MTYDEQRQALITYLKHKCEIGDWHGVSDAANDLRVLEAERRVAQDTFPKPQTIDPHAQPDRMTFEELRQLTDLQYRWAKERDGICPGQ